MTPRKILPRLALWGLILYCLNFCIHYITNGG